MAITQGRHRQGRAGHAETGNHHSEKAIGNSNLGFQFEGGERPGAWGLGGEGEMERGLRDGEGRTEAQREGREPETRTRRETHRDRKKVEREKQKQSTGCQVSPQHTLTLAHTHTHT